MLELKIKICLYIIEFPKTESFMAFDCTTKGVTKSNY